MSESKIKIAVIGAGIIGMSSALCLAESLSECEITIIADKWSPLTTSDASSGLIYPCLVGITETVQIIKWCNETMNYLSNIYWSSEASNAGICLISIYNLFKNKDEENEISLFSNEFISYKKLTITEMEKFEKSTDSQWFSGAQITTNIVDCAQLLSFMLRKYQIKGGKVDQKHINNFEDIIGLYDIIINCSGLGSMRLVPDQQMTPYRGQLVRVRAPWIKMAIMTADRYVLPNADTVILGRTKQIGDWNTEVNDGDSHAIIKDCCRLFPSLRNAPIVKQTVGLRPGRDKPRIDTQIIFSDKIDGGRAYIVHNYGHGSSGVTLFWGCAQQVLLLVNQLLN